MLATKRVESQGTQQNTLNGDLTLQDYQTRYKGDLVIGGDVIAGKGKKGQSLIVDGDIKVTGSITGFTQIEAKNIKAHNISNAYDVVAKKNIEVYNIEAERIFADSIKILRSAKVFSINANELVAESHCNVNIKMIHLKGNLKAASSDIQASTIEANDIEADFIMCDKIVQRNGSKLIAKNVITGASNYHATEWVRNEGTGIYERKAQPTLPFPSIRKT